MLDKLRQQQKELLAKIEEEERKELSKWYKVLVPDWKDGHDIVKYHVSYIAVKVLDQLDGYDVLEKYDDKEAMFKAVLGSNKCEKKASDNSPAQ
jgi:hypothetical protein